MNFKMVAKTLYGFEEILADELKNLGAQDVEQGTRSVSFKGDKGFMYKANLCLRTALKILKPIHSFRVVNETQLYNQLYNFAWEDYLSVTGTFAVEATLYSDHFNHSQYVVFKTYNGILKELKIFMYI